MVGSRRRTQSHRSLSTSRRRWANAFAKSIACRTYTITVHLYKTRRPIVSLPDNLDSLGTLVALGTAGKCVAMIEVDALADILWLVSCWRTRNSFRSLPALS